MRERHFDRLILGKLDEIKHALHALNERLNHMASDLSALQAAVAAEGTVIDSAITLLSGLSQQIADLKNDPAALQALADSVNAKAAALAAAVTANTPAAPAAR